ncbi:alpha-ketoglutarate-dependent dioxygenase AlkB [Streptomyces aureocirculatus]|uniref:alpha-ketoglutarate-dependent dioxygenase AlkB n=1 Tax=Streptomyces aureocirculatus TaxID=67275 RepID=UPI00099DF6C8|nr:alpha-ketoglutarate-dependent dioxygenase AlkB [Streptomyces aureocirculatus]
MTGELFPRERAEVAPGAVHVPDWLDSARQRELVAACREWARPPAGLRTVHLPGGGTMTARQVCLGWHWYPYGYARTVVDGDGAPVKPMPAWLAELGRTAVRAALPDRDSATYDGSDSATYDGGDSATYDGGDSATYEDSDQAAYDIALINFYGADARMGMHRDSDEQSTAPVVSLSLGDTCVFRFGTTGSRGRPYTDIELRSGVP